MAFSSSLAFLALAITTTLVASNTLALPPNKPSSVISAAPAPAPTTLFPNPPLSSPYQLPPDVAPLLPFSGGGAHSPAGTFIPTIPSSRSPPNPDITGSTGLDTAFGPSGPLQDSSARVLVKGFRNGVFSWLLAFWLVMMVFIV